MSERIPNGAKDVTPYDYEHSNPMSHEEAVELNAVELYVLKDLTPEQEVRFEEHYFDCQECACGVAVEQALIANAGMAQIAAKEAWWKRWTPRILPPVTAMLLGLVVFQHMELSETEFAANTAIVAKQAVMGGPTEGKAVTTPSVTIDINLPTDEPPSHFYRVEIMGEGKPPLSQVLEAPEDNRLSLQVRRRLLGSGSFNVLVYGLATQEAKEGPQIGQYYFNIH